MILYDVFRWFMPVFLTGAYLCSVPSPVRARGKTETQPTRQPGGQSRDARASIPSTNALKDFLYSRCTEGGQRLWDALSNAPMRGMFERGESRYGSAWFAAHFDANGDGEVTRREFSGSDELFRRLDGNHDGVVAVADFDWSDRSPLVASAQTGSHLLNLVDKDNNGRMSAQEWSEAFSNRTG
jgi:EF hand